MCLANTDLNKMIALIIGASGLSGEFCLRQLLTDNAYTKVIAYVRKPLNITNPKLEEVIIDFDNIPASATKITGDHLFICFGTTLKKAGSKENQFKIDYTYPVEFSKIAKQNGVSKVAVVSSIGANPHTSNFYLETKGKMEEALLNLNFETTCIVRPSFLLGPRKEVRIGEKMGILVFKAFSFFLSGSLKKYRAIHVEKVAKCMIETLKTKTGIQIIESDKLHAY